MAEPSIYQETQLVQAMKRRNKPVRALLNGSAAVRETLENRNGDNEPSIADYIPKEDNESRALYKNRMLRTYVTPYLKNAISSAAGQIFKNPITIKDKEKFDERLTNVLSNVDMVGSDINEWVMRATEESFSYGMVVAFVDFINPSDSDNLADQLESGARPFLKMVSYFDLLGYSYDSQGRITMMRFKEEASVNDEILGSDRVEQVRRVTAEGYEVYRKDAKGQDQLVESGTIERYDESGSRITDHIPISVMYGRKLGVLNAASVFEDMAWINIQHTQVNSDMSWSSHFYLTPFLFTILGKDSEPPEDGQPVVSTLASNINATLPEGSDIKWVETNGKTQESAARFIESIEARINLSKMDSTVSVTAGAKESATGRAIDASGTSAKLKLHAEAVESFAKSVIQMMASYMPDVSMPDFEVIANKDFSVAFDQMTIRDLSGMVSTGQLSLETLLSELKRRGILADDVDTIEELERISNAMAASGLVG